MKELIDEFLDSMHQCTPEEVEAVLVILNWTNEKRAAFQLAYKIWKQVGVTPFNHL